MGKSKEGAGLTKKQRFMRAIEMPYSSLNGTVRVTVYGNVKADVEGVTDIMEYGDGVVRLGTGKLSVSIFGSGLTLNEYSNEITVVEGLIASVQYGSR